MNGFPRPATEVFRFKHVSIQKNPPDPDRSPNPNSIQSPYSHNFRICSPFDIKDTVIFDQILKLESPDDGSIALLDRQGHATLIFTIGNKYNFAKSILGANPNVVVMRYEGRNRLEVVCSVMRTWQNCFESQTPFPCRYWDSFTNVELRKNYLGMLHWAFRLWDIEDEARRAGVDENGLYKILQSKQTAYIYEEDVLDKQIFEFSLLEEFFGSLMTWKPGCNFIETLCHNGQSLGSISRLEFASRDVLDQARQNPGVAEVLEQVEGLGLSVEVTSAA